jgi:hypothetical protein
MGVGEWLLIFYGAAWSGLWLVAVAVQVASLIHVVRTGRPLWWLWVIFMFPLIGVAAYAWLEVRPSLGKLDWQSLLWRLKSPAERIRVREANLEDSSTIKNRLALADELHAAGRFDRECQILEEGLRGAFKDDPELLMRLAQAHLEAGRPAKAEQQLEMAIPDRSPDAQLNHALLQARIAAALNRTEEAESNFQHLVSRKRSEAPRYYYAEFLLRQGRISHALPILKDIVQQYRRGTVVWRYQERRWFYAAKRLLKVAPRAAASPTASLVKADAAQVH